MPRAAAGVHRSEIERMGTGVGFIAVALVLLAGIGSFIGLFFRYRGKRIVTCPETNAPVGAKIDAALAAGTWLFTQPRFAITACSRWPERAGCDQACAPQVEASPQDTLVQNIVAKWYGEHSCTYCSQPIGQISGAAIAPALRTPNGELREWNEVAPEDLPQVLASSIAVCARCELAEDFRRRFLHRVTDRPATPLREHSMPVAPRRLVIKPSSQAVY
jgi:hypothetical protein